MSTVTYDARIRGWIALIFVGVFLGIFAFIIVLRVLGYIAGIAGTDMGTILQQCALYLGRLMGAILGYYFRSPPA